jgi:hypothetical protein
MALLLLGAALAVADNAKPATEPLRLSKQTRMDIIRGFTSELIYIRTTFPMGKTGLTLKDGVLSPNGEQLQQLLAMWGPAAKPGDRALITAVSIKDDRIRFEINGGPVRKKKWYQHIEVGGNAGTVPLDQDTNVNAHGSFVDLVFDKYIPELSPQQLKDLLRPALDFNAKTQLEAYLDTVPPKVKAAIQNHRVLVGMNREMVIYSKGRPPRKDREKDGETEYEEWIYGEPPQDVDFVRFVGDEVVRVETMKVDGSKMVRTEKEIELNPQPSEANTGQPETPPAGAPSLRRPGEAPDPDAPKQGSSRPTSLPAPPPTPLPPTPTGGGAPPQ